MVRTLVAIVSTLAFIVQSSAIELKDTKLYGAGWTGPEIQAFGDSLMTDSGGNYNFPLWPRAVITGNTHGNTTVDNLSSTTGLQVGATIIGSADIPSNATIASLTTGTCPAGCALTLSSPATGTTVGVSLTVPWRVPLGATFYNGHQNNSVLGWFKAITGSAVVWYPEHAYSGNYSGVYKVIVIDGGTGYSDTSTWTVNGSATVTAGTVTCTASVGVIQSCARSTEGSGYASTPTFTCNTGCGSGGVLSWVRNGGGTFAVSGFTTLQMTKIAADVCAQRPDWLLMDGGTNDITNGYTAAEILSRIGAMVDQFRDCGIRVALMKIPNRCTWSASGYTAAQAQSTLDRVNKGIEQIGRRARRDRPNDPGVVIVDINRYLTDPTNANGYAKTTYLQTDCLHPALGFGFWGAVALKQAIGNYLSPNIPSVYGQNDVYDATYFPSGNLHGTKGLFLGTSGTITGSICSGSAATGWTVRRNSGSGTVSCTASVDTRTDVPNGGNEQTLTVSSLTGGTSSELFQFYIGLSYSGSLVTGSTTGTITAGSKTLTVSDATNMAVGQGIQIDGSASEGPGMITIINAISGTTITLDDAAQVSVSGGTVRFGDRVYGSCEISVSNYNQVNRLGMYLQENSKSGSSLGQYSWALSGSPYATANLPAYTVVQSMPLADVLPGFVQGASGGAFTLYLRTQPMMVQPGSGGVSQGVEIGFDASSGTATGTLKARNCAVRKMTQ